MLLIIILTSFAVGTVFGILVGSNGVKQDVCVYARMKQSYKIRNRYFKITRDYEAEENQK